jgi:3-hydroxy-3-methylglutaryl CoA synthase/uncharacterized OB-fold protein
MPLAILRAGVHVPRLRLPRARIAEAMAWIRPAGEKHPAGTRAIANWDEDALTLAVEAARDCVETSALPPQRVTLCSTTAPFADRDDATLLAAALDLPEAIGTLNAAGSLRAATSALLGTPTASPGGAPALLVASDLRLTRPGSAQEQSYGDAAAALLLGPSHPSALATLIGAHSLADDFVDHYRMSGQRFDYALEERWARDEYLSKLVPRAVAALLSAAGVSPGEIAHLALPLTESTARRVAALSGLEKARRDTRVLEHIGEAGAAAPLLALIATLEHAQPGELLLAAGLGQGVDALLLRAEAGVRGFSPLARALAAGRAETSYVRYLSHRGLLEVDFGMRAERDQRSAHTVAWRKRESLSAFRGGRCERCGTVQFPRSRVCVDPACRATDTQSPYRLAASRGTVKTFTEDWQAYAARPPYVYGNVEFAEGGNLLMEFTDVEPGELAVGRTVRFVFRIKDEDRARQFRRYFWKATPIEA